MRKRVLILCTGNSCRSQMAEGLWNRLGGDKWEAFSAGSNPVGRVHPLAVTAMRELGIDVSRQRSKPLREYAGQSFDLLVTVCDSAQEACPVFPGAPQSVHWPFAHPGGACASPGEQLAVFRRVRDQIAERIRGYLSR